MIINFSEYLGRVKNDTGILGKAFIFKVIIDKNNTGYTFDAILFVHKSATCFVSVADQDMEYKEQIFKMIFAQYTLKQLLEVDEN